MLDCLQHTEKQVFFMSFQCFRSTNKENKLFFNVFGVRDLPQAVDLVESFQSVVSGPLGTPASQSYDHV